MGRVLSGDRLRGSLLGSLLRAFGRRDPGHLLALWLGRDPGSEDLSPVRLDQLRGVARSRRSVRRFAFPAVRLPVEIRQRHLI